DLLVGRHHVFASLDGLQDERAGRLFAAKDLDDDIHRRVVEYRACVGDQWRLEAHAARLVRVADQHLADLHRPPDATLQGVVLGQQHAGDAAADSAQTQEADAERAKSAHAAALAGRRVRTL